MDGIGWLTGWFVESSGGESNGWMGAPLASGGMTIWHEIVVSFMTKHEVHIINSFSSVSLSNMNFMLVITIITRTGFSIYTILYSTK